MKLRRITTPPTSHGCKASVHYETPDGRFRISRYWSVGGGGWQVRTTDGSKPFQSYFAHRRQTHGIFNGDTLADCKAEIEMTLEDA